MEKSLVAISVVQLANLLLYRWVARVFVLRPAWLHPPIFHNAAVRNLLVVGPVVLMVLLVGLSFFFTNSPWPFLALTVAGWIAFSPRRQNPSEGADREVSVSELTSADVEAGLTLYLQAAQLATRAIDRQEYEVGIFEIEAFMRLPAHARASPETQRNFLELREKLKTLLAAKTRQKQEIEPPRDVVEALIRRRENFTGQPALASNDHSWRASPEFKTLQLVARAASLCRFGLSEKDALEKIRASRELDDITADEGVVTINAAAVSFFHGSGAPIEHMTYTVQFARRINILKERT